MTRRPRTTGVAVLLVDVINAFEFSGCEPLVRAAQRVAPNIEALAQRARDHGVPVIYANDNFGRWRSNFSATVHECTQPSSRGRHVAERLRPQQRDYFVLKPQHSGFYSTPLGLLLDHLQVRSVVIAGFAANLCVAFSANDAHMRGFNVCVPRDCTASNTQALTTAALTNIETALHGATCRGADVSFAELARQKRKPRGQAF